MPRICPKCEEFTLHRSHSQNALEQVIKTLLPLRPYRCSACQWRGWRLRERGTVNKSKALKTFIFYLSVFLLSLFFALYFLKDMME
jgi:hypothetical protein